MHPGAQAGCSASGPVENAALQLCYLMCVGPHFSLQQLGSKLSSPQGVHQTQGIMFLLLFRGLAGHPKMRTAK